MSRQREELDSALEALQNEMRQTISKLDPKEMVWIHQPPGMPPILCKEPVVGAVPVCTTASARKPVGTVTGWYGGHPVIEPVDGWIPAVGTVLYSAPAPEQKPVAWMLMNDTQCHIMATDWKPEDLDGWKTAPLYTAPPARKSLTDEEIDAEFDRECWVTVVFADGTKGIALDRVTARDFARAIERAHGIAEP